jgi:hypothetical protein
MGWKGTLRSINAEVNRQSRQAAKRERALQKEYALQAAANAVSQQEEFLNRIVSIHHECHSNMDWHAILAEKSPSEPLAVTGRSDKVQRKVDRFKTNILDRVLKTGEWRRGRLNRKLEKAKDEDRREFEKQFNKFQQDKSDWSVRQDLSQRVLRGDPSAYMEALKQYAQLESLPVGKGIQFSYSDKGILAFDLNVLRQEDVVPDEEYGLRSSGSLSSKKMPKTKGIDIYQDHVCSCLLRVCREIFGLLPIESVQANALMNCLNSKTGHLEDMIVVSAQVKRSTLAQMNLNKIDPSDAMTNFVHNMKFTKSKGFDVVERIEEL